MKEYKSLKSIAQHKIIIKIILARILLFQRVFKIISFIYSCFPQLQKLFNDILFFKRVTRRSEVSLLSTLREADSH